MVQTSSGILSGSFPSPFSHALGSASIFGTIDLGNEAPLESDGQNHTQDERRRVSLRWLTGIILTGISGAALFGAAIYTALDQQSNFAESPEFSILLPQYGTTSSSINPQKGSRLVKDIDLIAAKQSYRAPTSVKIGNQETIKLRSFAHVLTEITSNNTSFAEEVPAFNPLSLSAGKEDSAEGTDLPPPQDDAEVSFVTVNLSHTTVFPTTGFLSAEEIQAQIREHVKNETSSGQKQFSALNSQVLLMRTSHAGSTILGNLPETGDNFSSTAPFNNIHVRMVPENQTIFPKTSSAERSVQSREILVIAKANDSLEGILKNAGVPPDQIPSILASLHLKHGEYNLSEGQKIKLLFAIPNDTSAALQLCRLSLYKEETLRAIIAITDSGKYVQSSVPTLSRPVAETSSEEEDNDPNARKLYNSFYETALRQEIPHHIINTMVGVFANDIDFQRAATTGDSFEALYAESGELDSQETLLYASIRARNETHQYYRFSNPEDNSIDYYDAQGRSMHKFLLRKPVAAGRFTSPFGRRRHPVLGYTRPHNGVDWAAPPGTPIYAAGDGTLKKVVLSSSYGRHIEIQHINGYVTTYSHLSAFARNIKEGIKVRQGQLIGYMGSSGLATGPHLHYEVIVNGHFVDPMQVKLGRTRTLKGAIMAIFLKERSRIDALIALAPNAPKATSASR